MTGMGQEHKQMGGVCDLRRWSKWNHSHVGGDCLLSHLLFFIVSPCLLPSSYSLSFSSLPRSRLCVCPHHSITHYTVRRVWTSELEYTHFKDIMKELCQIEQRPYSQYIWVPLGNYYCSLHGQGKYLETNKR